MSSCARVLIAAGLCFAWGLGAALAADAPGAGSLAQGLSHADETVPGAQSAQPKSEKIALYPTITTAQLQAIGEKYRLPIRAATTPSGDHYLVLTNSKGTNLGSIVPVACQKGACQAFVIGLALRKDVVTSAIIRAYEKKPRFANLLPSDEFVRFEMENVVAGGVTEVQIVNSILIYLDNLKAYVELVAGAGASASAAPAASLGFAGADKAPRIGLPSWLDGRSALPGAGPDAAAQMAHEVAVAQR